jgi:eukaryotic-like serine/threonine-protein kinase
VVGGAFRLEEPLSHHGGTAEVWRASGSDGDSFALKFLRPELEQHAAGRELLLREHELLCAARHPSVVATFGLIEHRGRVALMLEYLGAGDLVSLAGLPPAHWVGPAREVVGALQHLHAQGIVHRDLKLRNVLFRADGRVALVDFGSAARVGEPTPAGGVTAEYRSSAQSGLAEPGEDVFALAVMLHELLHGRLPRRLVAVDAPAGAPARPRWADDGLAALGALVAAVLFGNGTGNPGLSDFANVLESVAAEQR